MANSQCGEVPASGGVSAYHFFVFTSGSGYQDCAIGAPSSGGDVDGVVMDGVDRAGGFGATAAMYGVPGMPVRVEAGSAFSAGTFLDTDATGRAVAHTTGKAVARALETAAGAGSIVGIVFTSGR